MAFANARQFGLNEPTFNDVAGHQYNTINYLNAGNRYVAYNETSYLSYSHCC